MIVFSSIQSNDPLSKEILCIDCITRSPTRSPPWRFPSSISSKTTNQDVALAFALGLLLIALFAATGTLCVFAWYTWKRKFSVVSKMEIAIPAQIRSNLVLAKKLLDTIPEVDSKDSNLSHV